MKLTRVILGCTLLLLVSFPLFALPQCGECDAYNECVYSPYSGLPCRYNALGNCEEYFGRCSSRAPEAVSAIWTVASVETSRPRAEAKIVAAVAGTTEVCPTETTTEKK